MRIGIFGGCFSPPHRMHKRMVLDLIKQDYLDKVIFVPTGDMYKKKGLATFNDRVEMIKLLIQNENDLMVSRYEEGVLTYTYQTLAYFKKKYPNDEIYFICGSDNLNELDTWREYEKILENFKLLVILRGDKSEELLQKYSKYKENIVISKVREETLSSTWIRDSLKRGDLFQVEEFLDKKVLDYIKEHKLYA